MIKDEFLFINTIKQVTKKQNSLILGIGDDAALYGGSNLYDEIVCVDTMVEDIHFRKDTMVPYAIGYKSLAANISDIAAMGGFPLFYLVSLAIPPYWKEADLLSMYEGMSTLAIKYNMDLIGGDTVSTNDKLVLSVTVIGRVEKGKRLLRKNATPGDIVFVTGTIGGSAAGLSLLHEKGYDGMFTEEERRLVRAHQLPEPQVEAGRILAMLNERIALNDISDGIASEANEIADASAVQIILEQDKLPIDEDLKTFSEQKQSDWALFGGEDYQLIGTASPKSWPRIKKEFTEKKIAISEVGKVVAGNHNSVFLKKGEQLIKLAKKGYNHFSRSKGVEDEKNNY